MLDILKVSELSHWTSTAVLPALLILVVVLIMIAWRNRLQKLSIGHKSINLKNKNEVIQLIEEYQNNLEALKEDTRKLAQTEREMAWREMAKLVAHEIKNPLTPLKLGVQLLQKSWEAKDPDFDQKFSKFTHAFIEQIENLSVIVSEFSNFAKMPDMVLEKLDLRMLMEQVMEMYKPNPHINFNLVFEGSSAINILGDKDYLLRSLQNLIKNAIEAIPNHQLEKEIHIRIYQDKEQAQMEIRDNGTGIPEQLREHIFLPNFTTKSSGTGLGLAFVKQSLESIGGSIQFSTQEGRGTTFFISIPLAPE